MLYLKRVSVFWVNKNYFLWESTECEERRGREEWTGDAQKVAKREWRERTKKSPRGESGGEAQEKNNQQIKWDWDGQKEPRGSGSLVTRRSRKKARRESELWDMEPDGSAQCGVLDLVLGWRPDTEWGCEKIFFAARKRGRSWGGAKNGDTENHVSGREGSLKNFL